MLYARSKSDRVSGFRKFHTNMLHYHFIDVPSADFQLFISHSKKRGKKKTVCSASIYALYQNRNHIPAAAIILVNQHHLMHLAAVFQIQMKHLCKSNRPSALVLIDGGFVKMMQLVITSHQTPRRHNSA